MSGEDEIYEAAFAQTGALRMSSLQEMMDTAKAFSTCPLPKGNRLGIATTSGSLGVLAADMAVRNGLEVGDISPECMEEIAAQAPGFMNIRNPIDTGTAPLYGDCVKALMKDPLIDMVLCVVIMPYNLWKEVYTKAGIKFFGDLAAIREEFPEKPPHGSRHRKQPVCKGHGRDRRSQGPRLRHSRTRRQGPRQPLALRQVQPRLNVAEGDNHIYTSLRNSTAGASFPGGSLVSMRM